jgi:hypothetical protein
LQSDGQLRINTLLPSECHCVEGWHRDPLNTEDSNAGGGIVGALGGWGSICANRLGMERQS